jgi:hypothetical protein
MTMLQDASPMESTPSESTELLRRIVRAVEKGERHGWLEVTTAILLSLATTASAWCAYEATRWSGAQTFRLAAAMAASRDAGDASLAANQIRTFEATMLISYMEAKARGDKQIEDLLYVRFRPETKTAIDEWLKTDPLHNAAAPRSPFEMPGYVQPELVSAQRQNEISAAKYEAAQEASSIADNYVLLTVLFASVLFFGGIGSTFDSRRIRFGMLMVAVFLFGATMIAIATLPICRE